MPAPAYNKIKKKNLHEKTNRQRIFFFFKKKKNQQPLNAQE
jgi:hypothetical protein